MITTHGNMFNTNFRVIPLSLEFQFDIQADNLWVLETLGLLFKPSITESLLESNTLN